MVRQLAAEHPLDQGLLGPRRDDVDLALRHRARGAGCEIEASEAKDSAANWSRIVSKTSVGFGWRVRRIKTPHAMPHTKFLTLPSWYFSEAARSG
jgi:hypothetical protein